VNDRRHLGADSLSGPSVTYRDPDPDRVAETEAKLAADEEIERAAADGRVARVHRERGIEKRLLRPKRSVGRELVTWGGAFTTLFATLAAGATVPNALGAGFIVGTLSYSGAIWLDVWRGKREQRWADSHPFQVIGYVELLETRLVVTALVVHIELFTVEPDDRDRVNDLLGKLETVDPVVRIDGTTMVIEMLMAAPVKIFVRELIAKVVMPLHDARKVRAVHLKPSTADPSTPYDAYR
jgi:hypothetical protein